MIRALLVSLALCSAVYAQTIGPGPGGGGGSGTVTQGTIPWVVAPNTIDQSSFIFGTTPTYVVGGVYWSSIPALTTGQAGAAAMTSARSIYVNQAQIGGSNVVADPCQQQTKTTVPISQAGSGTIITGTASKKTYICSYIFNISDAESVSITEGTGSTCGGGTPTALLGSTTVANGMSLVASQGMAQGNGQATVIAAATTAADNVCALQSGTGRLAGTVSYVQQ